MAEHLVEIVQYVSPRPLMLIETINVTCDMIGLVQK
jgi:hypothetical protein